MNLISSLTKIDLKKIYKSYNQNKTCEIISKEIDKEISEEIYKQIYNDLINKQVCDFSCLDRLIEYLLNLNSIIYKSIWEIIALYVRMPMFLEYDINWQLTSINGNLLIY